MKGLKFNIELTTGSLDSDIKSIKKAARKGIHEELQKRVDKIIKDKNISLKDDGKICWGDNPVGRIKKGNDYLSPEIELLADDALPAESRKNLENFLKAWLMKYIDVSLGDLLNLTKTYSNGLRYMIFKFMKIMGL